MAGALASGTSDRAPAQKLDARYAISMTGIRVGQSAWTVTIDGDRYSAAASGGSVALRPVGTRVRFRLSRAAPVVFHVQRAAPGRRVGGRCVAPRRSNRGHRACVRYLTLRGSFGFAGRAGANAFHFPGRLRGHRLAPGRYRLVARAGSPGARSPARAIRFRIIR